MLIDSFKRLSKDSLVYGIGTIAEYVVSFLLLPVFTRIFSPSDYGVLDTIATLVSIILLILMFGLNSAAQRYYYEQSPADRVRLVSTGFWFLFMFSAGLTLILIVFNHQLSILLFNQPDFGRVLTAALASIPFSVLLYYLKDTLRLKFAAWKFVFLGLFDFVLRTGMIVFFIVYRHTGIIGNFLGTLSSIAVTFSIAFYFLRHDIRPRFSRLQLSRLLRYGYPLMFAGLAFWVVSLSDRFFLVKLSTLEQLGLYSTANKISSVLLLFSNAFSLAWSPYLFSTLNTLDVRPLIKKAVTLSFALYCFVGVGLSAVSYEVITIMAPASYLAANTVVNVLIGSLIFLSIAGVLATGLTLSKKTKYITVASIIAAATNVIFNLLLIPRFGMFGAAWSTLISYFVICLAYIFFGHRFYPIQYEWRKLITLILVSFVYLGFLPIIHLPNVFVSLLVKVLLALTFPVLLLLVRVIERTEVAALWQATQQVLRRKPSTVTPSQP